ncbi:MAG: hypothetical protein IPN70_04200 [Candidatus Moraniibacteriota bacterium]|nr:MAG: hypothetical protein IPN70_04200 [Candidatus Moranbacteria bacterium]
MEQKYEIEIKTLLGSKESADIFLEKLKEKFSEMKEIGKNSQLNHYFFGGDKEKIILEIGSILASGDSDRLRFLLEKASQISIRTRKADEKVLFVLKASIDDTTSSNGTARAELEGEVSLSLHELDQKLLECDCKVQAKWSRDRREYSLGEGTIVCIDRNAGYGYLAEFERIIQNPNDAEKTKEDLRRIMSEVGIEELPQDRLERMFAFYNEHWEEYYGTEKTFTLE